jgi:hypothetical protein
VSLRYERFNNAAESEQKGDVDLRVHRQARQREAVVNPLIDR